ncbi:MAG TPA: VWA domain-containing protein, partial [Alkalispirochaeta sp.]|nr:VWA domain-containing protein [Alkalispirochaeta sp.]
QFVGRHRRTEILNTLAVKGFVTAVLFTGAIASLIVALAGPQWGDISVEDERRGLDLVFLMDVSNSMVAEDIPPSRLVRSREVARSIVGRLDESYRAVVAFKGAATVVVPMTEDPVAFDLAMSNLSGALITTAGTSVRSGLDTALGAFPSGSPRQKAIILFSDGEELQDTVDDELERLRTADIPVFGVLTGTSGGATIPTRSGGVLRDEAGRPVMVSVNRNTLEQLSAASNGQVYDIGDTSVAQDIAADLRELSGWGRDVVFREVSVERYHLFVLLAFVLFTGIILVNHVRWRRSL